MSWRFPFVSRAVHEEALATRDETIAYLRGQLEKEQTRSGHLTDTVVNLKVSGASLVRAVSPDGGRLQPRPRSDVDQAIDENKYASSNPRLRAHLAAWADRELARDGADREAILNRLRVWSVVSAEDDDEDDDDDVIDVGGSE